MSRCRTVGLDRIGGPCGELVWSQTPAHANVSVDVVSPDGAAVVWAGYGYGTLDQVFMVTSAIAT